MLRWDQCRGMMSANPPKKMFTSMVVPGRSFFCPPQLFPQTPDRAPDQLFQDPRGSWNKALVRISLDLWGFRPPFCFRWRGTTRRRPSSSMRSTLCRPSEVSTSLQLPLLRSPSKIVRGVKNLFPHPPWSFHGPCPTEVVRWFSIYWDSCIPMNSPCITTVLWRFTTFLHGPLYETSHFHPISLFCC